MASWRDNLFPASYNDVPFSVIGHDRSGGRRLDVHEFPHRDRPYIEDLGRKANRLSIEAVLVGDDYLVRRDRLLAELDRGGIGRLSHPWLGLFNVGVEDWRLVEAYDFAGTCRLQISFVDGDAATTGGVEPITADRVTAAAAALTSAATSSLSRMRIPTSPASLLEQVARLQALASGLTAQVSQLQSWADTALVGPMASILRSAQSIRNDLQRLVALPGVLANTLSALAGGVFALFADDPDTGFQVAMSWADTDAGTEELATWQAHTGLAQAAVFLSSREFDNSTSALLARDQVLAAIERLEGIASDELYVALLDLRAAVVADVSAVSARLPVVGNYTPAATLPALVVAYQVYADAGRADEITIRNAVRNPGFVPGGEPLEVLTHG